MHSRDSKYLGGCEIIGVSAIEHTTVEIVTGGRESTRNSADVRVITFGNAPTTGLRPCFVRLFTVSAEVTQRAFLRPAYAPRKTNDSF